VSLQPVEEYTLARTALAAAKRSQAPKFASGHWIKAEEFYKKAQRNYEDREYDVAREEFIQARIYAEKAESKSRLRVAVSGDE
jgi:hypothetical protein